MSITPLKTLEHGMSTTVESDPIAPAGLLAAAKNGDQAAMLALSDWYGENVPPPDGDADEDLCLGFLLLAQECERGSVSLRHIGALLDRYMTAALPRPWLWPPARRPNRRSAYRIELYLTSIGFTPIGVISCGDTYRLRLPWDGQDRTTLVSGVIELLTSVFPGTQYSVDPTRDSTIGLAGLAGPADAAAYELGWME